MIDYYYEFPEGTKFMGENIRYALQRGYHPVDREIFQARVRAEAYRMCIREWIENANGLTLVREYGREVHVKCNPKVMTWIKLQAKEL